jgi:hypothetical protein
MGARARSKKGSAMPAFFQEVFACAGVEEDAKPYPGGIVPLDGSNFVRLVGGNGLRLDAPRGLKVEELTLLGFIQAVHSLRALFLSLLMNSLKPGGFSDTRYLRISAGAPRGPFRAQVNAVSLRNSKPEAVLDVAVLRPRNVKLSIRPVQIRDPQGALVFHSKKPFDTATMLEQMNSIWTGNANVVFKLVSSDPAPVAHEHEIARILDLKMTDKAPLPALVVLQRIADLFNGLKDKNADLTVFLVESAGDLADPKAPYRTATRVSGITDSALGISLISDDRTSLFELTAHEAGHRLGSFVGSKFVRFGLRGGPPDLMHEGGSTSAKIPFHDVIDFFNKPEGKSS